MNGTESIEVGDKLQCISNEGLSSVGSIRTITGLTETSINFNGDCQTSWQSRKTFRWGHYQLFPKGDVQDDR
jgi:hypothetical protein